MITLRLPREPALLDTAVEPTESLPHSIDIGLRLAPTETLASASVEDYGSGVITSVAVSGTTITCDVAGLAAGSLSLPVFTAIGSLGSVVRFVLLVKSTDPALEVAAVVIAPDHAAAVTPHVGVIGLLADLQTTAKGTLVAAINWLWLQITQVWTDSKDPTGFVDPEAVVVTGDAATRTVTLTGALDYYWRGSKRALAAPWTSPAHDVGDGPFFLSSADGTTFIWSSVPFVYSDIQVARFYKGYYFRECHGLLPWQAHRLQHNDPLGGSYRLSGGGAIAGSYALSPGAPTDADNTPSFAVAVIMDEDLPTTIAQVDVGTYARLYFTGARVPAFSTAAAVPFRVGAAYPLINTVASGVFSEVETVNNRWINVYQVLVPMAADATSQALRMQFLQPQVAFSSLAAAQAEDPATLDVSGLGNFAVEQVMFTRMTFRTSAAYNSTGKVRLEDLREVRSKLNISGTASAATTAEQVVVDASGFTRNLTTEDDTVLKALLALDTLNVSPLQGQGRQLDPLTSLTGWVKTNTGTAVVDTVDYIYPSASIKLDMTAGQGVNFAKTGTWDLTRQSLILAVKVSDLSAILASEVILWSGAAFVKWMTIATRIRVSNEWEYLCLSFGDLDSAYPDIDFSAVTKIDIRFTATANVNVWINDLRVVDNIYPVKVVFSFDDALLSHYTEAFPRLTLAGFRGVCFLTTGVLDTAGYLSSAQVKTMDGSGWDMGGHSSDFNTLTSLTRLQQIERISQSKSDLEALGITRGSRFFAFPSTLYTADLMKIVRRYYQQPVLGGTYFGTVAPQMYGLYRYTASTNTTMQHARIARAQLHGGVVMLIYHELGGAGYDLGLFQSTLDYVKNAGIEVATLSDIYDLPGVLSGAPPSMPQHAGGYVYIYGDEETDGSWRLNAKTGALLTQHRIAGAWVTV